MKTKRTFILILLLAVGIYLLRVWSFDAGRLTLYDDAFISLRYAQNLANGDGLVFNPGERVEGYTNFLWTVILAGAIYLGADPILAAKVLGTASGALLLVVTALLARRLVPHGGAWAGVPALILALTASLPRYALSGMETLLFTLWLVMATWLEIGGPPRHGPRLPALVFGLAALTRPEGLMFSTVWIAGTAIGRLLRPRPLRVVLPRLLQSAAIFCAIVLPYYLLRYLYYDSLLPNSFYAKVGGLTSAALQRGLTYLKLELLLLNLPLLAWALLGLRAFRQRAIRAMMVSSLIYLGYLVLIGGDDWAVFGPRFLLVIFPWMAVLGLAGLARLSSGRLPGIVLAALVIALTAGLSIFEARGYRGVMETMNRGWWTAAGWLEQEAGADQLLAIDAAGIIPYHSRLPVLDMLGLNNLHIARISVEQMGGGLAGHEKFDPLYVLEQQPDYIASWLDPQGQPISAGLALVSGQLQDQYDLAAVFLMGVPSASQPAWLDMRGLSYTAELNAGGYLYGIFRQRASARLK